MSESLVIKYSIFLEMQMKYRAYGFSAKKILKIPSDNDGKLLRLSQNENVLAHIVFRLQRQIDGSFLKGRGSISRKKSEKGICMLNGNSEGMVL